MFVGSLDLGGADEGATDVDAGELRLLLLAGRRMNGLADVDHGLLPGWHKRSRAWWCDAAGWPRHPALPWYL